MRNILGAFAIVIISVSMCLVALTGEVKSADRIIVYTNEIRAKYGLGELKESDLLDKSATIKACDMVNRKYWGHADPDGKRGWDLILEVGYDYRFAGENLARKIQNERVVNAWMESPTHREIMLKPEYKEMGVGRCGIFTVGHYGKHQ